MNDEKTTPSDSDSQSESTDTQVNDVKLESLKKRKKLLIVAGVLAVVLIAGGVLAAVSGSKDKNGNSDNRQSSQQNGMDQNDQFVREYLRGCKERQVGFTSAPLPLEQLGYIEPMGKTSDGHVTPTDHVYVSPNNSKAADNSFDVLMPADGTVISVGAMPAQYVGDRQQQTAPEDHRLVIAHNCQYVSIFIHVHQLSDALKNAIGSKLAPNTQKEVSIELKAGDKLGKIGGSPVDWSLMDAKHNLSGFVTPSLYQSEPWKIHVIDPFSVYTGDLKNKLISKSLRSVEPYGGKIDYDVRGALVGNWFLEGTNGYAGADQSRYWDGHLSIAPNYISPASTTVSMGNWQGKAAQFTAKAGSQDPANVTTKTGPVKYELVDTSYVTSTGQRWLGGFSDDIRLEQNGQVKGVLLVQVLDGEKLKVERFVGKTASQVSAFTNAAQTYVR